MTSVHPSSTARSTSVHEPFHAGAQAHGSLAPGEGQGEAPRDDVRLRRPLQAERLDIGHLAQAQDGPRQLDRLFERNQVLGEEDVRLPAEEHPEVGDVLLSKVVERRIGDLREVLVEVVVERARLAREDVRPRRVAHRANRLLALPDHREEHQVQLLLREREEVLPVRGGLQRLPERIRRRVRWRSTGSGSCAGRSGHRGSRGSGSVTKVHAPVLQVHLDAGSRVHGALAQHLALVDLEGAGLG